MEIKTRPLNSGECFICSFKSAKNIFKNTPVVLNFAYTHRAFGTFERTRDRFYVEKNVKGKVVSAMYMSSGRERALLSFFVLQQKDASGLLRLEFENEYLPKYYDFYNRVNDDFSDNRVYVLLVELVDGKLKGHLFHY